MIRNASKTARVLTARRMCSSAAATEPLTERAFDPTTLVAGAVLLAGAQIAMREEPAHDEDPKPKDVKLYYGDMHFWRAEAVRVALFMGNVEFEDIRNIPRAQLKQAGKLPFGAVPVMEVDGKILSQSGALAMYAGKLAGLEPKTSWEKAKVHEAIDGCTDVTGDIGKTFGMRPAEKLNARRQMILPDGRLTQHLTGIEKLLVANGSKGTVIGDEVTVADLAVWRCIGWVDGGVLDGIPKGHVASTYPQIAKLCAKVEAHPKVKEWQAAHPKNYKK